VVYASGGIEMADRIQAALSAHLGRRDVLKGAAGLAGMAALAACAPGSTASPAASGSPSAAPGASQSPFSDAVVAGILQDAPVPGVIFRDNFGPEWAARNSAVVDVELVDYDTLYTQIILDATSGKGQFGFFGLDILWTGQFATSKFALPLNDLIAANADLSTQINPVLLNGATWRGDLVGLPATNQSWNLFYRKDVFERLGIAPPETWDDFMRLAAELTGDWANDGQQHYGVAMNVKRGPFIIHDWLGYFAARGGEVFEGWPDVEKTTWRPRMNSEQGVKTLEMYRDMVQYAPPGVAEFDWNGTQTALDSGQVAMICSWNDGVNTKVFQPSSPVKDLIGWAQVPLDPGVPRFDPRGFWSASVSPVADDTSAIWDFLAYTASKEAQTMLVELYPGLAPVRDDLLDELATTEGPGSFLPFLKSLNSNDNPMNFAWRPTIPEWANIQEIFGLALNEGTLGITSPKQALDEGNAQLDKVMDEAGYY
jgi:multiple sugar transport system substrate-binding protein